MAISVNSFINTDIQKLLYSSKEKILSFTLCIFQGWSKLPFKWTTIIVWFCKQTTTESLVTTLAWDPAPSVNVRGILSNSIQFSRHQSIHSQPRCVCLVRPSCCSCSHLPSLSKHPALHWTSDYNHRSSAKNMVILHLHVIYIFQVCIDKLSSDPVEWKRVFKYKYF